MTTADEVLRFWIDEVGPKGWYEGGAALDRTCAERFGAAHAEARAGGYRDWLARPRDALAYLILTDQLPRNIHRNSGEAFSTDRDARWAVTVAINRGHDRKVDGLEQQFFYLPYMHAENRPMQELAVCLILTRMPRDPDGNLLHARAHREIIRRFGRFPFRNAALGRISSPAEVAFLEEEGYGGVVKRLKG